MANSKNELTQVQALEMAILTLETVCNNAVEGEGDRLDEVIAKLDAMKTAIENKNAKRKAKAKEMTEEEIAQFEAVKEVVADGKKRTVTEILSEAKLEISTSKGTQYIKAVDGIKNVKEGKKSLYFVE